MSITQTIFCQMQLDKPYTAKQLAEETHMPIASVYAAMRELCQGGVIVRDAMKPEKGRAVSVFKSHQSTII